MKGFWAGVVYFLIVFAAGSALGTARVLALAPRVGERAAELVEMPVMVGISFLAARWVVRRFAVGRSGRPMVGLVALALLVAAELGVVLWVRGETLGDYLAGRDPVAGTAYLMSLLLFAAMPLLARRGTGRETR